MNLQIESISDPLSLPNLAIEDKWILSKFNTLVEEVTENLEKYELGVALAKLYDFMWDVFCDWYIELVKPRLLNADSAETLAAQNVLAFVFTSALKLLHPFMPFITEEIWQKFPHEGESIMISDWPCADPRFNFCQEEETMKRILEVITSIRNRRSEMNVPVSKKVPLFIRTDHIDSFRDSAPFLMRLAGAASISFDEVSDPENCVSIVTDSATVLIPLFELLDIEKEKERLNGERKKILLEIDRLEKKLSNEQFVQKAPEKVVAAEREKLRNYHTTLANIEATLKTLNR